MGLGNGILDPASGILFYFPRLQQCMDGQGESNQANW